ncbi:type IV secretory system conjugative DNA transfer family protein [Xanthomonas sp. MUS 060]|uniref:type IV secretory system conjugative DNA transfer family protein n=1 Tax=Xanthomonas sp. MUS 060 TaxID=1588031 RepID=UPI002101B25D|nr:type IV secretory system conjugative DNA transfer family protein [Xanthomonas sp. MUS 060]
MQRISISASYGVRDLCIIQSNAQLRSVYGEHDAQNFTTNHAGSVVYTPREQADANAYSEQLGFKTIRRKHRSHGSGAQGSSYNINYTASNWDSRPSVASTALTAAARKAAATTSTTPKKNAR